MSATHAAERRWGAVAVVRKDATRVRLARECYSFRRRPGFGGRLHICHNHLEIGRTGEPQRGAEVKVRLRVLEVGSSVWCVMNGGQVNHTMRNVMQQTVKR